MVLFTKEVFLQLNKLNSIHVNVQAQAQYPGQPPLPQIWQVVISGSSSDANQNTMGMPDCSACINCDSKEDAYRVFADLAKQVVDSGTIPELNSKLMDDVLKGDVK